MFNDSQLNYSTKERINYEGMEMNLCTFWKVKDPIPAGVYSVDIYMDDDVIGSKSFELE